MFDLRDAVCDDVNPELFFSTSKTEIAYVKRFCAACPASTACLKLAMTSEQQDYSEGSKVYRYGVFGGLTGRERTALAKAQGRDATVTELATWGATEQASFAA